MIQFIPLSNITLGPVAISIHGLFLAFGVLIGYLAALRVIRKTDLDVEVFEGAVTAAVVAGLIGARLAYVLVLGEGMSFIEVLKVWEGGLSSHGGYISGLVVGILYLHVKKKVVFRYTDVVLPFLLLGWSIGRIGDFLTWGEYGIASNLPWAVSVFGTPRHPTQLYESLAYLIGFIVLLKIGKSWKFTKKPMVISALSILFFTSARFIIDFLRDDQSAYQLFSQGTTLILMLFSIAVLIGVQRKIRKK